MLIVDLPAIGKALEALVAETKHLPEDVSIVSPQEKKEIRASMRRILAGFGVDADATIDGLYYSEHARCGIFIDADDDSEVGLPTVAHFASNVRRMISLEKRCRGAVSYLHTRRGIRNFARYSVSFWERQFAERDSQQPYMVVVNPSDLEGNYLTQTKVYSGLQDSLAGLSAPHVMRMVEVMDVPDILRRFGELNKTYNANGNGNNPIAAVLYDGHGTAERVLVKRGGRGGLLGPQQLNAARFAEVFRKHLSKAYAKSAQFIFGSCEAGRTDYYDAAIGFVFRDIMQQVLDRSVRVSASPYSILPFTSIGASLKGGLLTIDAHASRYDDKTLRKHRDTLRDL